MSKVIDKGMMTGKVNGIQINSSLPCKAGYYNNCSSRTVSYICMHYTGNSKDTAKANASYYHSTNTRSASAHLFVDDNEIYQSVELRDIAWSVGANSYNHPSCRNSNSISIEMCCTAGNYKISKKTQINAAYLCANLCKKIGVSASEVDKYVLRHYDVTWKACPAQYVDHPEEFKQFKKWVKNILKTGKHNEEREEPVSDKEKVNIARATLKKGDKRSEVKILQKNLNSAIKANLKIDGEYGANTVSAVKNFQKKYNLTVDGIYGPLTEKKMDNVINK
jgi:N-acetylmuramoyl-L-alanine amidase CwlA